MMLLFARCHSGWDQPGLPVSQVYQAPSNMTYYISRVSQYIYKIITWILVTCLLSFTTVDITDNTSLWFFYHKVVNYLLDNLDGFMAMMGRRIEQHAMEQGLKYWS